MLGADPATPVSISVSPSSSLTRKQLTMPKRVRRTRFFVSWTSCTRLLAKSVMETVAQLDENFARIQVVRASKGKAVVEHHAAIGDVQGLHVQREALAETLPERQVKCRVRLQVGWRRISIG